MSKSKKKKEGAVVVTFRLDPEIKDQFTEKCTANFTDPSKVLRSAVFDYLNS